MPEPELRFVDLHQLRGDGGDQHVDRKCAGSGGRRVSTRVSQHRRRGQHLAEQRAVVQRGHQQRGSGKVGQIKRPGRERLLQTRRQRQPCGIPGVLAAEPPVRDRQFHQRQRVSRRLPQETLAHARRQPGERESSSAAAVGGASAPRVSDGSPASRNGVS